jgi:hypothetical protein
VDLLEKGYGCENKLELNTTTNVGHCLVVKFKCQNKHIFEWIGSEKLPDSTYQVNREMICCLETVGEKTKHYIELCEAMDIGVVDHFDMQK